MEKRNVEELLNEEIAEQIQALAYLEAGSKEKSDAIDDLVQLYKLRIEENKGIMDTENKRNQITEQINDRYFKVGIAAAELVLPLVFYGIWMKKGFKFEETGTITSSTFKGLINRFRPTKK